MGCDIYILLCSVGCDILMCRQAAGQTDTDQLLGSRPGRTGHVPEQSERYRRDQLVCRHDRHGGGEGGSPQEERSPV